MNTAANLHPQPTRASDRHSGPSFTDCEIMVLGAGPYGLSAGAYLKAKGFSVRVFGEPMEFWANKMPAGMLLRSPREASNIADPQGEFTLEAFERAAGRQAAAPLPLETFVEYGRWFKNQLGTDLDLRGVDRVRVENSHFRLDLHDGSAVRSRRVVVAAGVGPFSRKAPAFTHLSPEQASHCYEGRKVADLAGKRVAVIGAGQSALESAALLHEAGSDVEVIARIPRLRWIGSHPWLHRMGPISSMLYSKYDVGPVGISRLVAYPNVVSHLPLALKDKIRARAVRSAGSRWLPARLTSVKISTGRFVQTAKSARNEVLLKLDDGTERRVDHVLMGTGYQVDIARYQFLHPELLADIRRLGGYPDLGAGFCTSVPGLHFIGACAARRFGPLLNFVAGTEFASKELASYLSRHRSDKL